MNRPWLKFYDPHVPSTLSYPEISLPQLLAEGARKNPERIAVYFFGGKIRYKTLQNHVDQFAQGLISLGFGKTARLGILLPNMPQSIVSALGAMKARGIAVLLDPLAEAEEIQRQLHEVQIEYLVILDLVWRRLGRILPSTKVRHFIITGVKDYLPFPRNYLFQVAAKGKGIYVQVTPAPQIHLFQDFLNKKEFSAEVNWREEKRDFAEEAVILFTRGITAPPKPVILTHKNLIANICQIGAWIGAAEKKEGESFLSVAPFHRAYGFTLGMILPIYLQATSIQFPHFDLLQVLSLLKKYRPSFFPAQPAMIERFSTYLGLEKFHVQDIKICWSGEDPLPPEERENFEKKVGRKVCETYGLTEASPLTHAQPLRGKRKPGSIGLPLPDTEAKIVDSQEGRRELPMGEVGELIIKGPQVMRGYFGKPEETAQVLRAGWLHTGDLARRDEEGYFYIMGKKNKMKIAS